MRRQSSSSHIWQSKSASVGRKKKEKKCLQALAHTRMEQNGGKGESKMYLQKKRENAIKILFQQLIMAAC